jgi:hypothetical protein|nr:MAG TPA: hypothetical protein [Caudoviricetes sp.]
MTKSVKVDYSELSEDLTSLKDTIVKQLTIDGSGVIAQAEETFLSNLPEGVTKDMIKKVDAARERFYTASGAAAGELAVPAFKEHKDLKQVTFVTSAGNGHKVTHNIAREVQGTNSLTGKEYHNYGVLSTKVAISGAKATTGSLGKVRAAIGAAAASALG